MLPKLIVPSCQWCSCWKKHADTLLPSCTQRLHTIKSNIIGNQNTSKSFLACTSTSSCYHNNNNERYSGWDFTFNTEISEELLSSGKNQEHIRYSLLQWQKDCNLLQAEKLLEEGNLQEKGCNLTEEKNILIDLENLKKSFFQPRHFSCVEVKGTMPRHKMSTKRFLVLYLCN